MRGLHGAAAKMTYSTVIIQQQPPPWFPPPPPEGILLLVGECWGPILIPFACRETEITNIIQL